MCLLLYSEAERSSVGQLAYFCWLLATAHQPCCWCRRKGCRRVVAHFFSPFLFSLWSFIWVFWHFSSHKLFFKTYLSAKFVLLSINRRCVLYPSSVQHLGLHRKWNLCFERFPAARLELRELFPLHVLLLCKEKPRKFFSLIFSLTLEKGFVELHAVNPQQLIYCQHPGGVNQPGPVQRGTCK